MDAPQYPKGDLRRMLVVLGAIQEAEGATLVQIVARTGLDKKTVSDLIVKAQEQASVQVEHKTKIRWLQRYGSIGLLLFGVTLSVGGASGLVGDSFPVYFSIPLMLLGALCEAYSGYLLGGIFELSRSACKRLKEQGRPIPMVLAGAGLSIGGASLMIGSTWMSVAGIALMLFGSFVSTFGGLQIAAYVGRAKA